MVLKRQLDGSEEVPELPVKRRHFSTTFKGMNYGRTMQESVLCLEPMIRKWVQEAVECAIDPFVRSSYAQIECPGSRALRLQFDSNLATTLFTGSKIVSADERPIKIALYDTTSNKIVTSGPLSSVKVAIVVLDGDFETEDKEDWTPKEFEKKIVKNRDGKRPLVTGDLTVTLQGGVGYVGNIIFTDNSSWIRSGKFRLGAKVANSDQTGIREARSCAFKVKDHRGESYKKHHPPSLDDEVWRLEKVAKDGASHKKLTDNGINNVGQLLRRYNSNRSELHSILQHVSKKSWDAITGHAMECTLDDKKYLFRTIQGTGLLFNTVYKVVGVTFDGQTYHPVNTLDAFQERMVEDLKPYAYGNITDWLPVGESSIVSAADAFANCDLVLSGLDFQEQDQQGMEMSSGNQTISLPYKTIDEQDDCGFALAGSSNTFHSFNPMLRNSFGMSGSPGGFVIGGHLSWPPGGNYMGPQLSTDGLLTMDDTFQVKPLWQGNELFFDPSNHEIGTFSSDTGNVIPRNLTSRKNWCKVLAGVKWLILVRRNVAARNNNKYFSYV